MHLLCHGSHVTKAVFSRESDILTVLQNALNELKENCFNQKSKSRLSLEIIPHKSAPFLPAVAMEMFSTIFESSTAAEDMWRMRMCLCEWLCACVGETLYVFVTVCECVLCASCFVSVVLLRAALFTFSTGGSMAY